MILCLSISSANLLNADSCVTVEICVAITRFARSISVLCCRAVEIILEYDLHQNPAHVPAFCLICHSCCPGGLLQEPSVCNSHSQNLNAEWLLPCHIVWSQHSNLTPGLLLSLVFPLRPSMFLKSVFRTDLLRSSAVSAL